MNFLKRIFSSDSRALAEAADSGDYAKTKLLLEQGVTPDASWKGTTALYAAAFRGHTQIIELLLKNSAKVDKRCDDGSTPLFGASATGQLEAVRMLLQG